MLEKAMAHASGIVEFLENFQLGNIFSAVDFPQLQGPILTFFKVAPKALRNSEFYKLDRFLDFLTALQQTVADRVVALLTPSSSGIQEVLTSDAAGSSRSPNKNILLAPYEEFVQTMQEIRSFIRTWNAGFYGDEGASIAATTSSGSFPLGIPASVVRDTREATNGVRKSDKGNGGPNHEALRDVLLDLAITQSRRVRNDLNSTEAIELMKNRLRRIEETSRVSLLASRLGWLEEFRRDHEELHQTIVETLNTITSNNVKSTAYDESIKHNPLDLLAKTDRELIPGNQNDINLSKKESKIVQNVFSAYQRFAQGAGPFILERLHETSTLKHLFRDYENSVAAIENEM